MQTAVQIHEVRRIEFMVNNVLMDVILHTVNLSVGITLSLRSLFVTDVVLCPARLLIACTVVRNSDPEQDPETRAEDEFNDFQEFLYKFNNFQGLGYFVFKYEHI